MAFKLSYRAGALATVLLAAAGSAGAEPFTIFIFEPESEIALRTDQSEAGADYWAAWMAYSGVLAEAGAAKGGAPLTPAASVRADGMILGGYFIIEAEDQTAADALAAKAPSASRGGDAIAIAHLPAGPEMAIQ